MKKCSLAVPVGVGVFVVALVTVVVAFSTVDWLVSDHRITGAKLERLGLWSRCFRWLAPPWDEYLRRFFVGCLSVYEPFTTGYSGIRGFLAPPLTLPYQQLYTACLVTVVLSVIGVILLPLPYCGTGQIKFIILLWILADLLLIAGVTGVLGVILFALSANDWMPDGHFGWSFGLGVVGAVSCLISGALFLTEAIIQYKKRQVVNGYEESLELQKDEPNA